MLSSDPTKTFDESKHERTLLGFGYVRNIENESSLLIPGYIVDIVVLYCSLNQFHFVSNEYFDVSDDGLSFTKKKGSYATIQFGELLQKSDQIIYSVTFKMGKSISTGHVGIGFITEEFTEWEHKNGFNKCNDNHSCYIYGNGCYRGSSEFQKLNPKYAGLFAFREETQTLFGKSDKVVCELDLFEMKAKIYNSQYNDNVEDSSFYMFEYNLPEKIAIMIDMGSMEQTVTVVQQQFRYKT